MEKDFSELIGYLDEKFSKVDERFERVDKRFERVDERFFSIEQKIERLIESKADKEDVRKLTTAVDAYAKKADAYFQEMVILAHKVDRLEKWLHQVADKIGLKLDY